MRTSERLPALLIVVGLAAASVTPPAAARRGTSPRSQRASAAIVHGEELGGSQRRSTSFELLGVGRPSTRTVSASERVRPLIPQSPFGFDALADEFAQPSDTTGALGDSFFVAAVNTQISVFDRAGAQVVAPIQLDALHSDSVGRFAFDPKVVYDQYGDTFVMAYLVQEDAPRFSRIITVAIPNATADDTGTWCSTSFAGDQIPGGANLWADYPGVGYNQSRVTITTNQFTFPSFTASFRHAQVMTIDKGELYDCDQPPVPTVFAGSETRDNKGVQSFTLQPAQTVGITADIQLLLSFELVRGRRDYLTVWRIKPTTTGFGLQKGKIPTGTVSLPPLGTQDGGGLNNPNFWWDAGDFRLVNAFHDGDRGELFAAHAVLKNLKPDAVTNVYPEAAVQWYEVDPATKLGNSVLARKGVIGSAEVDVGWPTVATDGEGTLFVTYNRASAPRDEFLSAWVATVPPGSSADTQFLLHAGAARYDAKRGPERWGDFTSINRDPTNPLNLATFNQYAATSVQWQQFVSIVTDS